MTVPTVRNRKHGAGTKATSIVVADPDPLVRLSLENLLSEESSVVLVDQVADVDSLWHVLAEESIDTILVEITLLQDDGSTILRELKERFPSTQVIAMGTVVDPESILRILRLGASGYLPKRGEIESFRAALRQALVGMSPLLPDVAQQLLRHVIRDDRREAPDSPIAALSEREKEVLDCLMQGMCNKEIASSLQVTDRTVKAHVSSILRKMRVSDRTQAVLKAMRMREPFAS